MVDPSRVGGIFLFIGRVPDSGKVLPTEVETPRAAWAGSVEGIHDLPLHPVTWDGVSAPTFPSSNCHSSFFK